MWSSIFVNIILFSVVYCYKCPNDGSIFYHADVTTGCQVYHLCEDGNLKTLTCSQGYAYDYNYGRCKEAATVNCLETQDAGFRKHSSTKLTSQMNNGKANEETHLRELPEILEPYVDPLISRLFASIREMLVGEEETLASRLILPIVFDFLEDTETRFYLRQMYWIVKSAIAPVISDMYSQQTWDSPTGTIIRIPHSHIHAALEKIDNEALPLVRKIVEKNLARVLDRAADNVNLMFEAVDRLASTDSGRVGVLKDAIQRFFAKHHAVIRTSDSSHLHTFTLTEITEDLMPIKIAALQIFVEYLSKLNNSWANAFFNKDSYLYKAIVGGEEKFATPGKNFYKAIHDLKANRIVRKKKV